MFLTVVYLNYESGDDLFKKTKNWTKKKKVTVAVVVIVIAALVASVLYANFKPEELPSYTLVEVQKGDIQSTFDTQGTVESGSTETFTAAAGVRVLTVNVAVGDRVSAGQQLATFDVSTLSEELAAYKSAYDKAQSSYSKAAATVSEANANLNTVNSKIPAVEREIKQLEADVAAAENAKVSVPQVPAYSEEQIQDIIAQLQAGGMSEAQIQSVVAAIRTQSETVESAIRNSAAAKRAELAQKQAELTALQTQQTVYESQTDETVMTLYQNVAAQKKAEYESYKALVDTLKDGWTAAADGIVTEVNLTAGEIFTPALEQSSMDMSALLSMASGNSDVASVLSDIFSTTSGSSTSVGTGLVLENYGDFYASFTVGKYDLLDLKVGQPATVYSMGNVYDATVTYVSATASSSAGLDISTLTSSLTGGSSSSSNSAPVKVQIINPDEKIVLGFDVDISIDTEKIEDVITIPVEAVSTSDGENCVFVYNAEEKTVEKRLITLGSGSDTVYEVVDGLAIGEQIVMNPKTALQDGDKISVKA